MEDWARGFCISYSSGWEIDVQCYCLCVLDIRVYWVMIVGR